MSTNSRSIWLISLAFLHRHLLQVTSSAEDSLTSNEHRCQMGEGTVSSAISLVKSFLSYHSTSLRFSLPSPDTKLGELRQSCAERTHLAPNSFKLVHAGAVMKDDNAPSTFTDATFQPPAHTPQHPTVSAYGIKDRSVLAIIGTGEKLEQKPAVKAPPTEQSTITTIRSELEVVQNKLVPPLETFLSNITSPDPTVAASKSQLAHEHVRLGELLLQSLLRLDAITPEGQWEDARRERKLAVKQVQGLLDKLDEGWKGLKE